MTQLHAGAATDVGRVRQMNEDRYLADEALNLFAVADGVGGHQAGEVASQTSVETLQRAFGAGDHTTAGLVAAAEAANSAVWQLAQEHRDKRGMGTTLTGVALVQDDGEEQLALINVGDSRAYLLQQGQLVQLTEDHSLVEEMVRDGKLTHAEAQVHPQRSIITRALGMEPQVQVDYWQLIPYRGDRILLCSDGLTNELSDERIASTLRQLADPPDAARDLVRQARASGGGDNITVVVVDVVDDDGRSERASVALGQSGATQSQSRPAAPTSAPISAVALEPGAGARPAAPPPPAPVTGVSRLAPVPPPRPRRLTWRVAIFVVAVLAVVGVAGWAVAWYARGTYYVGIDNNQVAIFRGRPGGLLWFDPTLVERKQQPTPADLNGSEVNDLKAGHEVSSKRVADRFVNNLRQQVEERAKASTATTSSSSTSTTSTTRP